MNGQLFKFTIEPKPITATVVINATGYTQIGNSISVPEGTVIHYSVRKKGYGDNTNEYIMTDIDKTISVKCNAQRCSPTIFFYNFF